MTEAPPAHSARGGGRDNESAATALSPTEWLFLAATPTFAIMALLTGLGGKPDGQALFIWARGAPSRRWIAAIGCST